ncbi:MAG: hypothetical protein U1F06_00570 [Steroidobacteraceae bacterium]
MHQQRRCQRHADRGGAREAQHQWLRRQRQARVAGAQLARHEVSPPRVDQDAILGAARQREQQLVAKFVQTDGERALLLGEQRLHPRRQLRAERADAAGHGDQASAGRIGPGHARPTALVAQQRIRLATQFDDLVRPGPAWASRLLGSPAA